jgi:hypothetical protein
MDLYLLTTTRIYCQEIVRLVVIIPFVVIYSCFIWARRRLQNPKQYFLGFGPLPINLNHAPAVRRVNGRAESFSTQLYSIGGQVDVKLFSNSRTINFISRFLCIPFFFSITRYTHVFFYFDGGALGNGTLFLWKLEAFLYRLAGVKTIVSAYGSDVQSTKLMTNLKLKNAVSLDYPNQWRRNSRVEARIKYWCKSADFVLGSCDLVDYLPHWDKLVSSYCAVETSPIKELNQTRNSLPFRILHAPNHRNLKGSDEIERAVETLIREGLNIELSLLSGVLNSAVLEQIPMHDLVVDQLVIGWYAQFALEAISKGVPTICYTSERYRELYEGQFIAQGHTLPFISATQSNITEVLRDCYFNRESMATLKEQGRSFAVAFHSFETIGKLFNEIVLSIPR